MEKDKDKVKKHIQTGGREETLRSRGESRSPFEERVIKVPQMY